MSSRARVLLREQSGGGAKYVSSPAVERSVLAVVRAELAVEVVRWALPTRAAEHSVSGA